MSSWPERPGTRRSGAGEIAERITADRVRGLDVGVSLGYRRDTARYHDGIGIVTTTRPPTEERRSVTTREFVTSHLFEAGVFGAGSGIGVQRKRGRDRRRRRTAGRPAARQISRTDDRRSRTLLLRDGRGQLRESHRPCPRTRGSSRRSIAAVAPLRRQCTFEDFPSFLPSVLKIDDSIQTQHYYGHFPRHRPLLRHHPDPRHDVHRQGSLPPGPGGRQLRRAGYGQTGDAPRDRREPQPLPSDDRRSASARAARRKAADHERHPDPERPTRSW